VFKLQERLKSLGKDGDTATASGEASRVAHVHVFVFHGTDEPTRVASCSWPAKTEARPRRVGRDRRRGQDEWRN